MPDAPVRWGIIGLGHIADRLAQGIDAAENAVLAAVASRSADKAEQFTRQWRAAKAVKGYQALLDDPDVQVVHIALPNHLHKDWTIKAAQAGKHILCEKPFAVNTSHAEAMIDAAQKADVFLMEAFMYRCEHPATVRLLELIPTIGELRLMRLSVCYNMGPRYEDTRLSNRAAGGALMDVGCYSISIARLVTGEEPIEMIGTAHIGQRSRVDEWFSGILRFPSGVVAQLLAATQVDAGQRAEFYGSDGHIIVDRVNNPKPRGQAIEITVGNKTHVETVDVHKMPAQIEVEHVGRYLDQRQSPAMDWADTLGNQRVLDALRQEINLIFDCELANTT